MARQQNEFFPVCRRLVLIQIINLRFWGIDIVANLPYGNGKFPDMLIYCPFRNTKLGCYFTNRVTILWLKVVEFSPISSRLLLTNRPQIKVAF